MTATTSGKSRTIGIIGGGQLARMLAMAAARLNFRTIVLEPQADCPAAQICNRQIVAAYEDGWDRLRTAGQGAASPGEKLPRVVNFITGPSRTGDIEQRIVLGAHGPRALHIILVG